MTAAVQNRMVKTSFECFMDFKISQNASCILKSLPSLFHLFARTMGNILGFVDDLISCFLGCIGRVVYLLFGFVFQIAHGLAPFVLSISPGPFALFKNVLMPRR